MFKVEVTSNLDGLIELSKDLEQLQAHEAKVGVITDVQHPTAKMPMTKLAAIHVINGVPLKNIPKRDFIFEPVEKKRDEINALIKTLDKQLIEGDITPKEYYELLATKVQAIQQGSFTENNWQPLKPATVEAKKSETPLIDTGVLRNSITYEVTKK